MEVIKLKPTDDTPHVILDAEKGIYEISGRSMPEDVNDFYEPLLNWLEEYKTSPVETLEFVFKMQYFNTASSKLILDLMLKLEEIQEKGNDVKVAWFYEEDDEDMEEAGLEFNEMLEIPFTVNSY